MYVIAFSTVDKWKPFIVEVIDTDELGWYKGTQYEVIGQPFPMSEWPKNWWWAEWFPPEE